MLWIKIMIGKMKVKLRCIRRIESNTVKHSFFSVVWKFQQDMNFKEKEGHQAKHAAPEAFACEAQHVHWIWCLGRNLLGEVKCISWITCC